ncbi:MAG TPA: SMP-30/gluconolactonase/LRE family protein [Patescibacteria group bacterium]|nr:SMP-30/gluconolactonase/LRE family protein [Patescibacteria group bacterium]
MKAELLNPDLPASELGEGVNWDPRGKRLYWVDIMGQRIHSTNAEGQDYRAYKTPSMIGFMAMDEQGGCVAGLRDGFYKLKLAEEVQAEPITRPIYVDADNRFNDGKCDRRGRVWGGTMNHVDHKKPTGAFYRLDERGLHTQEEGVFISNGLGWSLDNKLMYYIDTGRGTLFVYDYDIETGAASNRRPLIEFKDKRPDGMCVDSHGRLFVALWGGWAVDIYSPQGELIDSIEVDSPQVSCCAFGGEDLKTLYISTAYVGLSDEKRVAAPHAGKTFKIRMDIPGLPETPARV